MEVKTMGEIIKGVAEVIQSFLTINLLDPRNVLSTLDFDEISRKRVLSVKLKGSFWVLITCMGELNKLRDKDFAMNVAINESRLELIANFYEQ